MPRSFPNADQGVPTLGTTIWHESPQGTPEAPPRVEPIVVAEDDVDIEILDSEPPVFSNLQRISRLERVMSTVTKQLAQLKGDVFLERRTAEQAKMAPMTVLTVTSSPLAVRKALAGRNILGWQKEMFFAKDLPNMILAAPLSTTSIFGTNPSISNCPLLVSRVAIAQESPHLS